MRAEGYAVESILRVLRQQGLEIAARTYRAWKNPARIAARTVTDALVEDKIRELAWTTNGVTGLIQMTPEGLYGRRKWVALLRRQEGLAGTSRGAVDRAMRALGLEGVRRVKKLRTTISDPDGNRASDLLNRDFTAPAPNRVWVTEHLALEGIAPSIGTVGDAYDCQSLSTRFRKDWGVLAGAV